MTCDVILDVDISHFGNYSHICGTFSSVAQTF